VLKSVLLTSPPDAAPLLLSTDLLVGMPYRQEKLHRISPNLNEVNIATLIHIADRAEKSFPWFNTRSEAIKPFSRFEACSFRFAQFRFIWIAYALSTTLTVCRPKISKQKSKYEVVFSVTCDPVIKKKFVVVVYFYTSAIFW
jgi:hypothetical protein